MQQDKKSKNNSNSMMQPKSAGTDPQEVKQQIQKDVAHGEGAMTSREAGHMRD